jgi:hypothetical protein
LADLVGFKGEEELMNEGCIPAVSGRVNEVFNHRKVITCLLPAPDLKTILVRKPIVLPHMSLLSISNGPETPFLEDPSSLHDASPGVATSMAEFCLHEVTVREVLSLKNPSNKRVRLSGYPPTLFGQQGIIEQTGPSEAQTSLFFVLTNLLPLHPVKFPFINVTSPPKFAGHAL